MTRIVEAADRDTLACFLAGEVAAVLEAALRDSGRAALAVPGGTTPAAFLSALGGHALDWAAVAVTLTDERCVPAGHPRSNRRLLDETLFAGPARAARFVALDDAQALAALLRSMPACWGWGRISRRLALPDADRLPRRFRRIARRRTSGCAPRRAGGAHHADRAGADRAGRCFVLIHGAEKRAALSGQTPQPALPIARSG